MALNFYQNKNFSQPIPRKSREGRRPTKLQVPAVLIHPGGGRVHHPQEARRTLAREERRPFRLHQDRRYGGEKHAHESKKRILGYARKLRGYALKLRGCAQKLRDTRIRGLPKLWKKIYNVTLNYPICHLFKITQTRISLT